MSLYTIMLRKFTCVLVAWKLAKTVGKYKVGAYIVSMDRKPTAYRLEAGKIVFLEKRIQAVPSNTFPYFTGLPLSSIEYYRAS